MKRLKVFDIKGHERTWHESTVDASYNGYFIDPVSGILWVNFKDTSAVGVVLRNVITFYEEDY